eukprot:2017420-Rhodomonas_salina.4
MPAGLALCAIRVACFRALFGPERRKYMHAERPPTSQLGTAVGISTMQSRFDVAGARCERRTLHDIDRIGMRFCVQERRAGGADDSRAI